MKAVLRSWTVPIVLASIAIAFSVWGGEPKKGDQKLFLDPIDLKAPAISSDKALKYDYDIVYVRAPRRGDRARSYWAEIAHPTLMDANADLMLLHPDGTEEVLVKTEEGCSVADPAVSL